MNTLEIQTKLKELGFDPGPLDGVEGPKTDAAIIHFKKSVGLRARAYVGPLTRLALWRAVTLPWMKEINQVVGLHEDRDNGALSRWLGLDGKYLGNPAAFPWCGDAVETAVYLALPDEPRFENPYWARNWAGFGVECNRVYGAVAVFKRGKGGHVGFLVGQTEDGKLLRIRGGNQSNQINDTWIAAERLVAKGLRWPATYETKHQKPVPILDYEGGFVSRNEA